MPSTARCPPLWMKLWTACGPGAASLWTTSGRPGDAPGGNASAGSTQSRLDQQQRPSTACGGKIVRLQKPRRLRFPEPEVADTTGAAPDGWLQQRLVFWVVGEPDVL